METYKQRLQRFKNSKPGEFILTILHNFENELKRELVMALENRCSDLLILGIHSVIETVSENIFLQKGVSGFKFYLKNFVDADKDGYRFSEIADVLNDLRNIIAHQKISKLGHSFGYDYDIQVGYKIDGSIIILNPSIYFEQFISAFEKGRKTKRRIWDYAQLLSPEHMEKAKRKFIQKFKKR